MQEWRIDEEVIVAVNHCCAEKFQQPQPQQQQRTSLILSEDTLSHPVAFILLGNREEWRIQTPVGVDITVDLDTGSLLWDVALVRERIRLLQVMHVTQLPVAVLVVDGELHDYVAFLNEVESVWPLIRSVVSYGIEECSLQCWDMGFMRQIGYVIIERDMSGYLPCNRSAVAEDLKLDLVEQGKIIGKLVQNVDRIVKYLESLTPDNKSPLQDVILRQCWRFVCKLQSPCTRDIEKEISMLESQWQLLNTLTTQFETTMMLD
ncbi:uncharacterized protein Ecym_4571 [Eremothecium cymbalariae DBVPG|uniref:Uncharacterized protein n=1 Tax=Eremothecium cymbalariae (strain CBS 270.75 / DBVPG 7215 / KCTC 17166 / NRRL Y-17582) TaxID=931890 RepID=G8JS82_ERECY|nr:hypothetical protein Ecym_4571 [Eremothecium cymbalariae DBVPG\